MPLTHEDPATEIVGGMIAAHNAAHELVEEQIARGMSHLRSVSKTRKSAMTRNRIMTAASELMAERGNTGFQMSEVSERCHMSKGSLYYYFADKDELISAIFDESVDDLVSVIESLAAKASSAREALRTLYAEFSRRLRAGSPLAMAMTYELVGAKDGSIPQVTSHFSRAAGVIAAQIERAKSEGLVREDVNSETAAVFTTGGLITMSMAVASGQATVDADVVSASRMDMILRGVGTEGATL